MVRNTKVVVIGGGIIGASIMYHLAKCGVTDVMLVEKSLFATGSTGYSGGFIRIYHSDPILSDLAWESFSHFQHFEKETGFPCGYVACGVLHMEGSTGAPAMRAEYERLVQRGAPLEWIECEKGRTRFPCFQWEGIECAIYEPYSGYADPVMTTNAYIQSAARLGARACEGIEVEELLIENQRVIGVNTSIGAIEASAVVVANGAWGASFLKKYTKGELYAKRIQIQFYEHRFDGEHPAFIDATTGLYGRPYRKGVSLVGYPCSPSEVDPDISVPLSVKDFPSVAALQRLPFVNRDVYIGGRRAFDGYTVDQRGIWGPSPQTEGLWFAVGMSGGGYKLAPAVGNTLAHQIRESLLVRS